VAYIALANAASTRASASFNPLEGLHCLTTQRMHLLVILCCRTTRLYVVTVKQFQPSRIVCEPGANKVSSHCDCCLIIDTDNLNKMCDQIDDRESTKVLSSVADFKSRTYHVQGDFTPQE
jgi:hypothetical protein